MTVDLTKKIIDDIKYGVGFVLTNNGNIKTDYGDEIDAKYLVAELAAMLSRSEQAMAQLAWNIDYERYGAENPEAYRLYNYN